MVTLRHSLGFRMGLMAAALLVSALVLLLSGLDVLRELQTNYAWSRLVGQGSAHGYRLRYLAERLRQAEPANREQLAADLRGAISDVQARYEALISGDPAQGIQAGVAPALTQKIVANRAWFQENMQPALLALASARTADEVQTAYQGLRGLSAEFVTNTDETVREAQQLVTARIVG